MTTTPVSTFPPARVARIGRQNGFANGYERQAKIIATELEEKIRGEVRFDAGNRALYSTDASNYREIPVGVVVPKDKHDVINTVALCHQHGVPILARGGGTSLAGQCCNVAVVIDFSKYMNQVLWIDPEQKLARVQAGTVLDDLQKQAETHGLVFGPDPATHNHCTLGGMIGNNSCGIHSVMAEFYGPGPRTSDNIESLEVLTYDGIVMEVGPTSEAELHEIIQAGGRRGDIYAHLCELRDRHGELIRQRYPQIPRRVSGYENLDQLFPENNFNVAQALVGTECTCALVLEATVKLIQTPHARSLLVLGYPDIFEAGQDVPLIRQHRPIGLEGLDHFLIDYQQQKSMHPQALALLPEGEGYLLVEFGGDSKQEAEDQARRLMDQLNQRDQPPHMSLFKERGAEQWLWEVRESGLGATARIPNTPDTWPGWEDTAVAPEDIGPYLRDLRALYNKYGYEAALYGHFGQGLVHCRATFDLWTAPGIAKFRAFLNEGTDLVVRYGGTLSGEHGDGQARAELLPKMYGHEMMDVFREFKRIWDPQWKMNPGKVIDPKPITFDLRLGSDYHPWEPETHFKYPNDDFRFSRAVLRCVGVGKCRREGGGTMCPSYMVTREEKHSTRGRARLLFEMLQKDVLQDGWQDESVKEALDLCLACKGCKSDCPVGVDMATYKAEFLSHYYDGKLRPRAAYSMGLIYWWARLAALAPGLANFLSQTPGLRAIAKAVAGIAPERDLPTFAPQTFKQWFRQREPRHQDKPRVILWPDTFNNHFFPEAAKAAVDVLEAAGFQVIVPAQSLCCGRPLYDWGMLDTAQKLWQQILEALRREIRAGVPLVGLEPSCTAAFRDELVNLLPHDEDAQRLSRQTYTLSEFLEKEAPDFEIPKLHRQAVVHGHCHHKSIMDMQAEQAVLDKLGLDYELLESGCCGMAGSFGFEAGERYEVSVLAGERVLLPAVRAADKDTLIITNGFSCREQISQGTDRKALHLAQVLQMALETEPADSSQNYPERDYYGEPARLSWVKLGLATSLIFLAGWLWLLRKLGNNKVGE
ncbi:MAG TPA: FAD-binding and (Fe-S)-binding domain-containing protein [Anaerolineae bacterium]|nr:FAD-binding and (Fe-S)-binding domain-containing protein [Anaerolineae bacterium]